MKFLKFFFSRIKKLTKGFFIRFMSIFFFIFIFVMYLFLDGYTLEDFGFDGVTLNPTDYCNLTRVNYTAILHDDPNGKANVEITEYLTFDVHAGSRDNTFKELWRELPEQYVDGLKVTYDVKSVTQVMDDGTEIPYEETKKMYWEDSDYTKSSTYRWHHSKGNGRYPDNDESLLIYIPWTYREKMTFKVVYSMNNAALKYNDCSELYLSMYSGSTIKKLESYKAQILIPNYLMPDTYYAYSYGTTNSRIPFTESSTVNPGYYTFSFDLDKSDLKFDFYNRYIEFSLLSYGADKHSFTKYAPNNQYSSDNVLDECIKENEYYETQNIRFKKYKTILLIFSLVSSGLIVLSSKHKYKKIKDKYTFYEPEIDYEFFRDIPSDLDPIFASELVFMKDPFNENKEKKEEYAAILLSLVRKKYVKLINAENTNNWNNKNTVIYLEPIRTEYFYDNQTDYSVDSIYETNNNIEQNYSSEQVYKIINDNTGDILEPLTTSERLYLDLLKRHARSLGDSITLSYLQNKINSDYDYTNSFVKDIEKKPALENGVMKGYFQDTNYDAPQKKLRNSAKVNLAFGLILLFFVNAISYFTPMSLSYGAYTILGIAFLYRYFYLLAKSSNAVLFTQYGANEQAKWFGLYNFLNSDTLINEREIHELPLWEKYLIYATAFGISEKVIKAIKLHTAEMNIDSSLILNNHSYIHSHSFHSTSRSFGHSIHTSSRGGGFGGHGYGGGGRGGGGGGGGH